MFDRICRCRWSYGVVGQTVSIDPDPALATGLKHYYFAMVMSRGERLCEREFA